MSQSGTIALVVSIRGGLPQLVDTFSDEYEIGMLEDAINQGDHDPLSPVYEARARQEKEDEEFGNYIEDLLSRPFVRPEIQEHAVQWFKSKLRIEEFKQSEAEACRVISEFAYQLFRENPGRIDFILAGPNAEVRVRVFLLEDAESLTDPQAA